MKRFSLTVKSTLSDDFEKKGRYHSIKDARKAYFDSKDAMNLERGKITDNLTKKESFVL